MLLQGCSLALHVQMHACMANSEWRMLHLRQMLLKPLTMHACDVPAALAQGMAPKCALMSTRNTTVCSL